MTEEVLEKVMEADKNGGSCARCFFFVLDEEKKKVRRHSSKIFFESRKY
jgi:hypothetical protein